ncbi:hypothetical protein [Halalkalibacterium halodurans]|uniref:hypothetical protein n=1 Tax=Halalkalibacterium halodurans TaxID=86665 RepID=UPI002AA9DFB4|nr:hypothetical protein [Halalkalibacterium halodurans]MDY7222840.1 hypothetical protein [Halalkalibacterium halodurans]MDY7242061.1 hypothetical protein [Halalkalibacterium halodurans]
MDQGYRTIYHSNRFKDDTIKVIELEIYIDSNGKITELNEIKSKMVLEKDLHSDQFASQAFLEPLEEEVSNSSIYDSNVPRYKLNGGSNSNDFYNFHAYKRHHYNPERKSTASRTQYAKNTDVYFLWRGTRAQPDSTYREGDRYFYRRAYTSNISTSDTPTRQHRFIYNRSDNLKSTHFPYVSN